MITFKQKVLNIVKNIKKGSVLTYKEVATKAGNSRASRAVGSIMRKNFDPSIPCHRVIKSDGSVGEYNRGGSKAKISILLKEGVSTRLFKKATVRSRAVIRPLLGSARLQWSYDRGII